MTGRAHVTVAFVALVLIGFAREGSGSCACLYPLQPAEALKAQFDLVAVGTVLEAREVEPVPPEAPASRLLVRPERQRVVKVEVTRVWKGPQQKELALLMGWPAVRCDLVPRLEVGTEYLLFAERSGGAWLVNNCNPTRAMNRDVEAWSKSLGKPAWKRRRTRR